MSHNSTRPKGNHGVIIILRLKVYCHILSAVEAGSDMLLASHDFSCCTLRTLVA